MGGTLGALLLPVLGEMAPEDLRRCLGGVVPCACIENPLWVIQWEWVVGAVLGFSVSGTRANKLGAKRNIHGRMSIRRQSYSIARASRKGIYFCTMTLTLTTITIILITI